MLKTPLGEIILYLNNEKIPFNIENLDNSYMGKRGTPVFNVEGRYKIPVNIIDLKSPLSVSCVFGEENTFNDSGIESGERLALKTWENGNLMLSIGTEDEIEGTNIEYLERGIKINIEKPNIADNVVFVIAWIYIKDYEKERNYTWFAADPLL